MARGSLRKTPGAPVQRRLIRRISTEPKAQQIGLSLAVIAAEQSETPAEGAALRYPSPVHTIALTKKYIVMIQIPYPLNWAGSLGHPYTVVLR